MKLIKQFDGSDCGPACLAMIANYFGKQVSLTQMRERAGTDRNSTNLNGLIIAASKVGLNAQAVKGGEGSLSTEVPVPCIAHVKRGEQFHFVAIYKISKTHVFIADPEGVKRKLSYEDFYKEVESPGLFSLAFLRHVLYFPMSFFDMRKTGEILSRLSDTIRIREALSSASFSLFFDTIMVVVIGVVLAIQNLQLFFIAVAFVPLSAAVVWGFARPFRRKYQEILGNQAESQASL